MTDRGEDYADGGFESAARVFYPDPAQIARINEWWARLTAGGRSMSSLHQPDPEVTREIGPVENLLNRRMAKAVSMMGLPPRDALHTDLEDDGPDQAPMRTV